MLNRIRRIFGFKKKVTLSEFAEIYRTVIGRLSSDLEEQIANDFKEVESVQNPSPIDRLELIILNYWIVSALNSEKKNLLNIIHADFVEKFSSLFELSKEELKNLVIERYKQYYTAWQTNNDSSTKASAVAEIFLKNRFDGELDQPHIHFVTAYPTAIHILCGMGFIADVQKDFCIKES